MTDGERPMPLSELPGYMRHARENGQGDESPVVEMGRIVDDGPRRVWFRPLALAAACLLLAGGVYAASSTEEITIVSGAGIREVSEIVSGEGGRVISVRKEGDGAYRVRVMNFGGLKSLVERLRENKDVKRVGQP